MKPSASHFGWLAIVFALTFSGCVSPQVSSSRLTGDALCSWGGVEIFTDFEAARADRCEAGPDGFLLTILPETDPINPSPWYAFKIVADAPQSVDVTLRYPGFKHRYRPKTSQDRTVWMRLANDRVTFDLQRTTATLSLLVGEIPTYVSAQEVIASNEYTRWTADLVTAFPYLQIADIGQSSMGRSLFRIESLAQSEQSVGTIMLVGRQHPPEVSGVFALFSFAEEIFGDSHLAQDFRNRFSIVLIPALNPDGVAAGNWRMNAGNVDLNRDWGPFSQPETQAMREELIRIHERDRLALFLDFHSTFKNVIYTQTDDTITNPLDFAARWHSAMSEADRQFGMVRQGGDDTDRTTSKAYVFNTYGSAAITFEVYEEENREKIRSFSSMAAREMMKILLADAEAERNNTTD